MATLQTGAANSYLLLNFSLTESLSVEAKTTYKEFYMTFVLAQQRL